MTYDSHEKIRHAFMAHMTREAPPGLKGPDMSAFLRADRELWMRAFDKCKSDLKVNAQGRFPLDVAMLDLYTSPEVVFHLLPTPGSVSRKRSRTKSETKQKKSKVEKPSPPRGGGKGGGKHKKQQGRVMVPNSLKGYSGFNSKKM